MKINFYHNLCELYVCMYSNTRAPPYFIVIDINAQTKIIHKNKKLQKCLIIIS